MMSRRSLLLLSLASLLLLHRPAFAGAWTQEPGHFYTSLSFAYYFADNAIDDTGMAVPLQIVRTKPRFSQVASRFSDSTISLYGELGLWPKHLNVVFYVPVQKFLQDEAKDGMSGYSDSGVGDSTLALKYKFYDCAFVFSGQFEIGVPSGNALNKNIPTGDNEWSYEGRLLFGKAFERIPLFIDLEVGFRKRTTGLTLDHGFTGAIHPINYSDDIPLFLQVGYNLRFKTAHFSKSLLILANLNGIFSTRDGDKTMMDPVSGVSSTANNASFLAAGLGLSWNVIGGLLVNFDSRFFLWGQNTGQGYSFSGGLGYSW